MSEEEAKAFLGELESAFQISDKTEWLFDVSQDETFLSEAYALWKETEDNDAFKERLRPVLARLQQRIRQEENPGNAWMKRRNMFYSVLSKVAMILLIPLVALTIFKWDRLFFGASDNLAKAELHSPYGARTQFYLPDGSKGWLNSGSSIAFPLAFNGATREVYLQGEAFFDVVTNPDRPFIVNTGNISVRARGTAFVVSDFDGIGESEVTLVEGMLDVFGPDNKGRQQKLKEMAPGTHYRINHIDGSSEFRRVNSSQYTSWIQGKLVFRNDPMLTVTRKLERWYNVDIEIKDHDLLTHTYYATFSDESLEEVLRLISLTTPIKYEIIYQVVDANHEYSRKRVIISMK